MAWQVTIDNGSTFTDGCLLADGAVRTVKVLTTPYDLMRCFVEVFRGLAGAAGLAGEADLLRRIDEVRYSTTSGTNALLVRKGVRVGVVAGRDGAEGLYGLRAEAPEIVQALVGDRVAAIELGEAAGEELDARILGSIRELLGKGAQWIVVSLPEPRGADGERGFKARYMKLLPGHLLGSVPVLFSRELCADPDDRRRTATSILNGFLHREMARFLYHADGWIRERHVAQPLRIMRNDGGCGRVAKTTAVKTLDSGPMGGLSGAAALAALRGLDRVVTVDVGGTSADIGVVEAGRPAMDVFGSAQGLPLSLPFPALRTAALGGGSLFRVEAGAIRIGPESAGALPGPVSFGRGGETPTLTDAALVAGYLDAERFADGAIALRLELAEEAIVSTIGRPLGLDGPRAGAWAMIEAFAGRLAAEIGAVVRERSWAGDKAVLMPFGGSGPLLACLVADEIGIRELVIPPASAGFSALGVGFAELAHEYRACLGRPAEPAAWRDLVAALHERGRRDMFGEGAAGASATSSLRVRAADGDVEVGEPDGPPAIVSRGNGAAVVDYRVAVRGSGQPGFPKTDAAGGPPSAARRDVLFGPKPSATAVVGARELRPGATGSGPCLLETAFWSAVVPAGWAWAQGELGLQLSRR